MQCILFLQMLSSEAVCYTKKNKAVAVISVNIPNKTRLITGWTKKKSEFCEIGHLSYKVGFSFFPLSIPSTLENRNFDDINTAC